MKSQVRMMRNKVKILLVDIGIEQSPGFGFNEVIEPIGICYIGAYVKEKHNEVDVKIFQREPNEDLDRFKNKIKKEIQNSREANVILGFTSITANYQVIEGFCKEIKSEEKNIWFVVGGSHPTGVMNYLSLKEITRLSNIDDSVREEITKYIFETFHFIVTNEGDESFEKIVSSIMVNQTKEDVYNDLIDQEAKGIAFLKDDRIFYWGAPERMNSFSYPISSFNLRENLPTDWYLAWQIPPAPPGNPDEKIASVLFSRGCNGRCNFCINSFMWGRPVYKRDVNNLMKELKELYRNGVKYTWFQDESFTQGILNGNLGSLLEELRKFKEKHEDFYFSAMGRVRDFAQAGDDNIRESLEKLKTAGCWLLSIGVEFSDEERLKNVKGLKSREIVKKVFSQIFSYGIVPSAFFILGMPKTIKNGKVELESLEDWIDIVNFAIEIDALRYRFTFFYPFLGTEIRNTIDGFSNRYEILLSPDILTKLELATTEKPVIKAKRSGNSPEEDTLTEDEMIGFRNMIYSDIYSSKKFFLRLLKFADFGKDQEESMKKWLEMLGGFVTINWDEICMEIMQRYGADVSIEDVNQFIVEKLYLEKREKKIDVGKNGELGIGEDDIDIYLRLNNFFRLGSELTLDQALSKEEWKDNLKREFKFFYKWKVSQCLKEQ